MVGLHLWPVHRRGTVRFTLVDAMGQKRGFFNDINLARHTTVRTLALYEQSPVADQRDPVCWGSKARTLTGERRVHQKLEVTGARLMASYIPALYTPPRRTRMLPWLKSNYARIVSTPVCRCSATTIST
jgi:hypothetical protein